MYTITITPRFGEVDSLGHINNNIPSTWFELARNPIIDIFDPSKELKRESFTLILVHADYDYVGQLYYKYDVEIKTFITRIGTKSFTVYQEAWQQEKLCVKGSIVLVHYNFNTEESIPIPEDKKELLNRHFVN
jgi:acyl-CoA thioester hydrolase